MRRTNSEEVLAQSRSALAQWGEQWSENARRNGEIYKKRPTTQRQIRGNGMGRQIVVAGMGYSLDRDYMDLADNRDKADLMCVDKAFGELASRGLCPRYVVLADANVPASYAGDWGKTKGVYLIMNVCGNPEWAENWQGPIIYYVNKDNIKTQDIYSKISGVKELIPASSNVGNTAVLIAAMIMGYDRILLTGFDYCWQHGKPYYAWSGDDDRPDTATKRYWMKRIHSINSKGESIVTSANLSFSARWLSDFIAHSLPGRNIIDTSGGMLDIMQGNLKRLLESWTDRKPENAEINNLMNARLEKIIAQDPEQFNSIVKKLGNTIVGIEINYMPMETGKLLESARVA